MPKPSTKKVSDLHWSRWILQFFSPPSPPSHPKSSQVDPPSVSDAPSRTRNLARPHFLLFNLLHLLPSSLPPFPLRPSLHLSTPHLSMPATSPKEESNLHWRIWIPPFVLKSHSDGRAHIRRVAGHPIPDMAESVCTRSNVICADVLNLRFRQCLAKEGAVVCGRLAVC